MKQPKVTTTPPQAPAPAILRGPRYRYFSTTPTKVTLRMRDLQLPEKARTATYDSEQFVDLPCEDIFRSGPVPKIRLARLAELAPDCVTAAEMPDEGIKLCSARLALAYAVTEGRELIEEPPAPELPTPPAPVVEDFAPPISAKKDPELKTAGPASPEKPKDEKIAPPKPSEPLTEKPASPPDPEFRPRRRWLEAYRQRMKSEAPAAQATLSPGEMPAGKPTEPPIKSEAPAKPPAETKTGTKPASDTPAKPPANIKPEAATESETPASNSKPIPGSLSELPPPAAKSPLEPTKPIEPNPQEAGPKTEIPSPMPVPVEAKRPFSLFPKFRRKEAEEPKPSVIVPRNRIEIPKPKRPIAPLTAPPLSSLPGDTAAPAIPVPEAPGAMAPIPPPAAKPPFEPAKSFEPKPPASAPKAEAPAPEPLLKVEPPAPKPPAEAEKIGHPEPPAKPPVPEPPAPSPAPVASKLPPPPPALTPPTPEPPSQTPLKSEVPPPPIVTSTSGTPAVVKPLIAQPPVVAPPVATPSSGTPPPPIAPPAIVEPPAALLVETEHLTKEQERPEIAEQDALQAIFLTEEFLSVDRVLELCGNLPGIRSCVLSSGANVIASHNAPDSVDIVSLSAHALDMIRSMRASAAKMGIGAVPAVTVHSEKGPITFFHQDDLCLLVLHKDRGFIPGVREKLEQVVHELSEAKLPLRLGQGTVKKMLGS